MHINVTGSTKYERSSEKGSAKLVQDKLMNSLLARSGTHARKESERCDNGQRNFDVLAAVGRCFCGQQCVADPGERRRENEIEERDEIGLKVT